VSEEANAKAVWVDTALQNAAQKLTQYARSLRRGHRCHATGEWDSEEIHAEFAECLLLAFHLRMLAPAVVARVVKVGVTPRSREAVLN
jgi:hypothetical protein